MKLIQHLYVDLLIFSQYFKKYNLFFIIAKLHLLNYNIKELQNSALKFLQNKIKLFCHLLHIYKNKFQHFKIFIKT